MTAPINGVVPTDAMLENGVFLCHGRSQWALASAIYDRCAAAGIAAFVDQHAFAPSTYAVRDDAASAAATQSILRTLIGLAPASASAMRAELFHVVRMSQAAVVILDAGFGGEWCEFELAAIARRGSAMHIVLVICDDTASDLVGQANVTPVLAREFASTDALAGEVVDALSRCGVEATIYRCTANGCTQRARLVRECLWQTQWLCKFSLHCNAQPVPHMRLFDVWRAGDARCASLIAREYGLQLCGVGASSVDASSARCVRIKCVRERDAWRWWMGWFLGLVWLLFTCSQDTCVTRGVLALTTALGRLAALIAWMRPVLARLPVLVGALQRVGEDYAATITAPMAMIKFQHNLFANFECDFAVVAALDADRCARFLAGELRRVGYDVALAAPTDRRPIQSARCVVVMLSAGLVDIDYWHRATEHQLVIPIFTATANIGGANGSTACVRRLKRYSGVDFRSKGFARETGDEFEARALQFVLRVTDIDVCQGFSVWTNRCFRCFDCGTRLMHLVDCFFARGTPVACFKWRASLKCRRCGGVATSSSNALHNRMREAVNELFNWQRQTIATD